MKLSTVITIVSLVVGAASSGCSGANFDMPLPDDSKLSASPPDDDAESDAATDSGSASADSADPSDALLGDSGGVDVLDAATPDTATSDTAAPDTAAPDTAAPDTAAPDTAAPDTAVPDTAPPPKCPLPIGVSATADKTVEGHVAALAVDGKLSSYWTSGDWNGRLEIVLGAPTKFDRVAIAAVSSSVDADLTYTLVGYTGGVAKNLGTATRRASVTPAAVWLVPIDVPLGTYERLQISAVSAGAPASCPACTWVSIADVAVYDSSTGCTL